MTDIPEHIMDEARKLLATGIWQTDAATETLASALAAAEQRGAERERERWQPAAVYYERYCQDEADDPENCVCGERQHEDAKAFAAAIRGDQP